ncbi:nucleoside-diphosphate kinase [Nematocida sp. LUAm3]|nr:nucleoside-diphosphate kinase [Nematocida sp. LUAm3]KAI5175799.1 nucleoside-diphosphate kinase [Nematocida sp. LUAm2]KAI5178295.1 nucleoside-diphosphate kinase [Nematocida sp. LUAm1]
MEYTYVMIKPDGTQRRLVGEIISRIERKGYGIAHIEMGIAKEEVLKEHYAHLKDKPFFPGIIEYMTSGSVVKMIVTGKGVVSGIRKMLGETNPMAAAVGTIRGDLSVDTSRNLCHASDSFENAQKEVKLWLSNASTECRLFDSQLIYE